MPPPSRDRNSHTGIGPAPFRGNNQAPEWTKSDNCALCGVVFSTIKRKHHCRRCGKSMCSQCSSKESALPDFGHDKPVRVCDTCFRDVTVSPSKRDREEREAKECGDLEAMVEVDYSNLEHWEEQSSTKASVIVHQGWAIELNDTWQESKQPKRHVPGQNFRASKDILDKWRNKWFRVSLNPNQFAYFADKPNPINKKTSDCNPLGVFPIDGYAEVATTSLFRRPFVLSMQTMARSWLLVLPSQDELTRFKVAFEKTIHSEREIQDALNWDERRILPTAADMGLASSIMLGRDMMAASHQDVGILDADVEARIGIQVVIVDAGADSESSEESGEEYYQDGEAGEAKPRGSKVERPSRSSGSKHTPRAIASVAASLSLPSPTNAPTTTTISAITAVAVGSKASDDIATPIASILTTTTTTATSATTTTVAVATTTTLSLVTSSAFTPQEHTSALAFSFVQSSSLDSVSSLSTSINNIQSTLSSSFTEDHALPSSSLNDRSSELECKAAPAVGLENLQLNPNGCLTLTRAQAKLLAGQGTLTLEDGAGRRPGGTQNATLKLSKKGADALDALSQLPTASVSAQVLQPHPALPKASFGTQPESAQAILKVERFALSFPGTGIVLSIKGTKPSGFTVAQVSATVLGEDIWVALNNKTAWAARTALRVVRGQLPLMLCPKPFLPTMFQVGESNFDLALSFGAKGKGVAGQLNSARCIKRLRFLAERDGDPWMEFLFQYFTEDQVTRETAGHKVKVLPKKAAKAATLFKWQTRPSLLLKQLGK